MSEKRRSSRLELLAPGGSVEAIRASIAAGADAVYTGGQLFGARAYARNAGQDELLEMIDLCHLHGKHLYLTVNTLLKEHEIRTQLWNYLEPYYRRGLDAVLVQDFGVLRFLRQEFPDLPVHASTQMSVSSVAGTKLLEQAGVTRVVLARELPLSEIRTIAQSTSLEIETFIHGALCYSYSGQCLMSSMIGGRSGNRGRCAQPCRQQYECVSGGKTGRKGALLSLKDICTLQILPDLVDAGITTFKIEGRMKRFEYAAGVTAVYRKYLDLIRNGETEYAVRQQDLTDLMDLYNRGGFSEGYYPACKGPEMMSMDRANHAGTPAVKILDEKKGQGVRAEALEDLYCDDVLELEDRGGTESLSVRVEADTAAGNSLKLKMPDHVRLEKGQILPRVRSERLLEQIRGECRPEDHKIPLWGWFRAAEGENITLTVSLFRKDGNEVTVTAAGDCPARAKSVSAVLREEECIRRLSKTGDTPFYFETLECDIPEGLFLPVSALNALRREALSLLEEEILSRYRRECVKYDQGLRPPVTEPERDALQTFFSASVRTARQAAALLSDPVIGRICLDCMMFWPPDGKGEAEVPADEMIRMHKEAGKQVFLMLPPVWNETVKEAFFRIFPEKILGQFDGFVVCNFQELGEEAFHSGKHRIVCDESVYTWNQFAREQIALWGADTDTVPSELNRKELEQRGCLGSEINIYGREVLMTTAQCVQKNIAGCTKQNDTLVLADRIGERFPVQCLCGICSNRIYNSTPLDLTGRAGAVLSLGCSSVRIRFTFEEEQQVREVAERVRTAFKASGSGGKQPAASDFSGPGKRNESGQSIKTTRGHFARGVE